MSGQVLTSRDGSVQRLVTETLLNPVLSATWLDTNTRPRSTTNAFHSCQICPRNTRETQSCGQEIRLKHHPHSYSPRHIGQRARIHDQNYQHRSGERADRRWPARNTRARSTKRTQGTRWHRIHHSTEAGRPLGEPSCASGLPVPVLGSALTYADPQRIRSGCSSRRRYGAVRRGRQLPSAIRNGSGGISR